MSFAWLTGRDQAGRLVRLLALSILFSIGGIVYAVHFGTACDGGRGGALGVAVAFFALFTASGSLEGYIEARDAKGTPQFDYLPTFERIKRLRSALAVLADRQRQEARYLTFASIFGTIVWGFGDIIAGWFNAAAC